MSSSHVSLCHRPSGWPAQPSHAKILFFLSRWPCQPLTHYDCQSQFLWVCIGPSAVKLWISLPLTLLKLARVQYLNLCNQIKIDFVMWPCVLLTAKKNCALVNTYTGCFKVGSNFCINMVLNFPQTPFQQVQWVHILLYTFSSLQTILLNFL